MGGSPNLLLPVGARAMSSWAAHQRRSPRSTEPGTDFYCPIGTPVLAPADGRIYGYGSSIGPMTGRWVGIDFDNGLRFRVMHLARLVRTSGRVKRGEVIAYSGASGYGKEDWSSDPHTGGAHAHVTLWPSHVTRYGYDKQSGRPFTVDFMQYVRGAQSAGESASKPASKEWDEMASPEEISKIVVKAISEALQRRGDVVVIHYTTPPRDGIVLAGFDFWHPLTEEEWFIFGDGHELRGNLRELHPTNDREYDVLKSIYTTGGPSAPAIQPATMTPEQVAQIAAQIGADLDVDVDDAVVAKIAKAVRAQLAADPLTVS